MTFHLWNTHFPLTDLHISTFHASSCYITRLPSRQFICTCLSSCNHHTQPTHTCTQCITIKTVLWTTHNIQCYNPFIQQFYTVMTIYHSTLEQPPPQMFSFYVAVNLISIHMYCDQVNSTSTSAHR